MITSEDIYYFKKNINFILEHTEEDYFQSVFDIVSLAIRYYELEKKVYGAKQ